MSRKGRKQLKKIEAEHEALKKRIKKLNAEKANLGQFSEQFVCLTVSDTTVVSNTILVPKT